MRKIIVFLVTLVLAFALAASVVATTYEERPLTVNISLSVPVRTVDPSQPMIALTFDDGPDLPTIQILDTLEKYGGSATFFVVGERVDEWSEVLERMHRNGFEAVGHSWNHPNMTTLSAQEVARHIIEPHNAIEAVIGPIPKIFRPPFGAQNANVRRVAEELGFAVVNWSVDPLDWYVLDAETIAHRVLRDARDGDIVLMHDLLEVTATAMQCIVPELTARGYQLVTVSELFRYRGVALQPGGLYLSAPPRSNSTPISSENIISRHHHLVPLRTIAETLGYNVNWHPEVQSITIENSTITLGNRYFTVGERLHITPVAPFIKNGHTLVTTCTLYQLFGVQVCYNSVPNAIAISLDI